MKSYINTFDRSHIMFYTASPNHNIIVSKVTQNVIKAKKLTLKSTYCIQMS